MIINDRIVGVRASRWYWLISIIHGPIVILGGVLGFLILGFNSEFGLLVLALSFLDLVLVVLNLIFVFPIMEKVLRGKDFSIDELEERKDFEARRGDVWEVEVRRPQALGQGLLELRLRSGDTFRIRMMWIWHSEERFAEMFRFVETFTARRPLYNYKGGAIWRLN